MNRFFQNEQGVAFDIDVVKNNLLKLNNADLKAYLSNTDWQIIRANDPTSQKPVNQEVLNGRQQKRKLCENIELKINQSNTIKELEDIYNQYL